MSSGEFYSLVFAYDLDRMVDSGRHWAKDGYKSTDYIFQYSAASIATFLHHNPFFTYTAYTDDVALLAKHVDAYDVNVDKLNIMSRRVDIARWKAESSYAFNPIVQLAHEQYDGEHWAFKLDNDLVCLKPIDKLLQHDGAILWKRERMCSDGKEYWGERLACRTALGTDDFPIYNMGVFALGGRHHAVGRHVRELCEKIAAVDISSVSQFPDKPGFKAKSWFAAEQSAVSYALHAAGVPIIESYEYFDHVCYTKSKQGVLDGAKFLLKEKE